MTSYDHRRAIDDADSLTATDEGHGRCVTCGVEVIRTRTDLHPVPRWLGEDGEHPECAESTCRIEPYTGWYVTYGAGPHDHDGPHDSPAAAGTARRRGGDAISPATRLRRGYVDRWTRAVVTGPAVTGEPWREFVDALRGARG